MSTDKILFVIRGKINQPAKTDLRKAGVVVVEVESLGDFKFVHATPELPTSVLLNAAGDAILVSDGAIKAFGTAIAKAIKEPKP